MSKSHYEIAHELYYMKDSGRTTLRSTNMHLVRGMDFSVAFSYDTPIAVFPDHGRYVLLDAHHFSPSTGKHQCYLWRACPANVEIVSLDWYDKNRLWDCTFDTSFEDLLPLFTQHLVSRIDRIGKNRDSLVYIRDRESNLCQLNGLRDYFTTCAPNYRIRKRIDRKMELFRDKEAIRKAQKAYAKAHAAERAAQRAKVKHEKATNHLSLYIRQHSEVLNLFGYYTDNLVRFYPLSDLNEFRAYCNTQSRVSIRNGLERMVCSRLSTAMDDSWSAAHRGAGTMCNADIRYYGNGYFMTTHRVSITYDELQRCLRLWKRGQLLGEKVDSRYVVLHNTPEELVIGCHHFRQETVRQIYDRYAGKSLEEIAAAETKHKTEFRAICEKVIRECSSRIADLIREEDWAAPLLSNPYAA